MTMANATEAATSGGSSERGAARGDSMKQIAIIVGVAALIGLLIYLGGARRLEKSAIGMDGLGLWLEENGVETLPLISQNADEVGKALRILPIYDINIAALSTEERERDYLEEERGPLSLRQITEDAIATKARSGPTLAVLPKWRGGVIDRGRVHPDLLVSPVRMRFFEERPIRRLSEAGLADYSVADRRTGTVLQDRGKLYSAQVLSERFDELCRPLLTIPGRGTLLADCTGAFFEAEGQTAPFYLLSDPDLVNNHGLANGANPALALTILRDLAGGQPVFIDNEPGAAPRTEEIAGRDTRERTISDLERFFAYPFSLFWIGAALATGLALWRGSRRFGRPDEEAEPADASKRRTIEASQRILLLAKADRALIDMHVRDRLEALASGLLGPRRKGRSESDDLTALTKFLYRRQPGLSTRLAEAYRAVIEPVAGERSRFEALAAFESVIQETWHEFGRLAGPARQDRR
ncbi:hypothetical protein [Jiella marina]|uniref:hypothetical protein n=1 Tax=Jiella sp. LLJ827 TaxID=2917712 RepID=UPI0021018C3E|nr:hypothetical protein [Jiella sp. LLJ827]MCQ0987092.1 hypothetical protein [Jiella sp. LLJ827]